ncbi:Multi antimicrobial extrusion protein (Na(+)/drug antiporter), MATE family of MDR efflux pumps [Helicobacter heilmannii]|uniref:MATE family efflux transporter n=1 Tax=Helicobacter heilmannii TaxID=35817 RepID=UPI0006A1364D|nr:MATE family efflux transporter [Helicobacter heilmannii]CRF47969.1 Multi antimicrobial extrusion protein (Na(+)/drug antiporter), MATE family of MDR efflux pumps [Helicobacter heilmannii]
MAVDLKTTPIPRLFFYYFIPLAFSMISLSTYSIIDGMFVGNKLGKNALAAVGVCWPIFPTLIAYELLFGLGAASIASYFLGKDHIKRARLVFSSVFYFVVISILIVSWALVPFSDKIAKMLGSSDLLLPMVSIYIKVILIGAVFMVLHPLADVFVVNDKRPILAMIAMLVGSLTNVLLNYLLLYIFEVGICGSAIATVLGHAVGFFVLFSHFLLKKGQLYFVRRFNWASVISSAKSGLPQSVSELSAAIVMLLFNHTIMHTTNERDVSIYAIVAYNGIVFWTTLLAIGQGIQPIASFSYGAGHIDRVKAVFLFGLKASLCVALGLYVIFYFGDTYLIRLYVGVEQLANDPNFLQDTKSAMNIFYAGHIFLGVNLFSAIFFQSIQRTKSSFLITICETIVFIALLLPILSRLMGIQGIWIAYPLSQFLALIVAAFVVRYEIKRGTFHENYIKKICYNTPCKSKRS